VGLHTGDRDGLAESGLAERNCHGVSYRCHCVSGPHHVFVANRFAVDPSTKQPLVRPQYAPR
jgi:hypothetical protein